MRIRLFFIILSFLSILICRGQYTHYLWFDDNFKDVMTMTGDKLTADIDVSGLKEGIHIARHYVQMADGSVTTPKSAMFLKSSSLGKDQPIHCIVRIDNSINKVINSNVTDGLVHLDVDMSDIHDGIHQISVQLISESNTVPVSTTTSFFLKSASIEDGTEIDCHAIIDNSIQRLIRCTPSGGVMHFDIDMQDLTNGIHQITMYLVPVGSSTIIDPVSAFFIKMPVGGSRISRYSYWFDNNTDEMVSYECEEESSTIGFLGLIDAKILPFRSSSYGFGIDGDNVILTSKHDFNFRAMDNNGRFSNTNTKTYIDNRSQIIIPCEEIENLTSCKNKKVGTIEENDIKLFKFKAEVGDSLSLCLSQPASFELYSPAGETIIEKKGRLSQSLSTKVLVETGIYYLAIHDIVGNNKDNESLTFNHVPRNAILDVSPDIIAAPGSFLSLELFGNGFNNARKLILENNNGTHFEVDSINAIDNYHLIAAVEYGADITCGEYHVLLLVDDKVSEEEVLIEYPRSIKIEERHHNAKINVEVIPSRKASSPYMVDIMITNKSDVPCWGIPFNVACELSENEDEEQIRYEFFMKDFFGWDVPLESFKWHETENLLGTEIPGVLLPMVISYLNPHETRVLRVGILSKPHQKVGLYAWTGEPYNEAFDRFMNMTSEERDSMKFRTSNLYSFETYPYLLWVMEELASKLDSAPSGIMKAPSDNDWVLEYLGEYIPDAVADIEGMGPGVDLVQSNVAVYNALAKTFSGIVNSLNNRGSYDFFKNQRDIPGNTLSEQIAYIYSHNMQHADPGIELHLEQVAKNMARTASPNKIMSELLEDLTDVPAQATEAVLDYYSNQQAQSPNPQPQRRRIESLQSGDPNEISGYLDPTGGPYIGIDVSRLQYKIEFENDPAIANASASVVRVENKLDGAVFDLSSYKPLAVRIGNHNVKLPEDKSFVTTVDMRPGINCILEIRHDYNEVSGESVWTFNSLDPISLENVTDSKQGFLPVNDSNEIGVGEIEYCIDIRANLSHNAVISNKANIIFDDNEAIETPEWVNVTDYVRPTGKIVRFEAGSDGKSYVFDVDCSDEGSGLNSYDLCAKTKDSDKWIVIKPDITESSVEYVLSKAIDNLEFAVRAIDKAGNRQISDGNHTTSMEEVIELPVQVDEQDKLWYNINGQRVDKCNIINTPIISNTGERIIILR